MRVAFCFLLITLGLAGERDPASLDRRPLREARSKNELFRLRVHSGRPSRAAGGHCRAVLFKQVGAKASARRVWTATLANEIAPRQALIRDDGRFVVTLDEFRRGGAAHAVVIYGQQGKRLREFGLRELLRGDDWDNLKVERRAIEWLSGADFTFVDKPPQFVITLEWGREIHIDLEHLEIAKDAGVSQQGDSEMKTDIPPEILALLAQTTSAPSTTGEALTEGSDQAVLHALEELGRLAALSGVEVEGLKAPSPAAVARNDADELAGIAGNSYTTSAVVPAPDPANPADYESWVLEQTRTDGPSAATLYQAAIDDAVDWEGDAALFGAALDGDSTALSSPEIVEWLAANADALAQFRAATELEYRGFPMETEDGLLIGFQLPHLSRMRLLSKAAVIQARQFEAEGNLDAAMGNYLDTLAVGSQASQGPTLIENLVGMAIQSLASDRLLDTFAADAAADLDYAALADGLSRTYESTRPVEDTYQFERAMALDIVQRGFEVNPETSHYRVSEEGIETVGRALGIIEADNTPALAEVAIGVMLGTKGFERMVEQVNTHYDALTDAARMPYQQAQQALDEIEAPLDEPGFGFRNPLLTHLLPSLRRATFVTVRNETSRRATLLVANLKSHRQQYGTYPESLGVFGDSDIVFDPFTDEYFAYRRDGDGFVLYSLGANGADDGGMHDWRGNTNDLVYWPRPPKD